MNTITLDAISNASRYASSIAGGILADDTMRVPFGVNDDGEAMTAYDYISEALDIEYRVNSRGEYISAYVYICLGGPTAWIDTLARDVVVVWDGRDSQGLPAVFIDGLNEALAELWEARA